MSLEFSRCLDQIPPSGIRRFFDLVIGAKDIISLGVGEPDFSTPWSIRETAISTLEQGITSYTSNSGLLECRQQISAYLVSRFNTLYSPDEMMLTMGVSEGVDVALRALMNPGDEVIILEPGYVCYSPLVTLAGGVPVSVDTSKTGFIPDPVQIARCVTNNTKALILCSPNNPTGTVVPKETLEAIAALSEQHGFWVITDEIYAELHYDGIYTSYASLPGVKSRTILLSGFSKAFAMTGWRLGYLCGPKSLLERTLKIHQYSALCAPIMAQYAAIEALKNSLGEVEIMRKSYLARRNFFVQKLNDAGLETPLPLGAFYTFSDIRKTGLSSEEFALRFLESERVAVVPGSAFGPCGEGFIRCCYATDMALLKEASLRLKRFVKTLQ